jgi:hypothetical protein
LPVSQHTLGRRMTGKLEVGRPSKCELGFHGKAGRCQESL